MPTPSGLYFAPLPTHTAPRAGTPTPTPPHTPDTLRFAATPLTRLLNPPQCGLPPQDTNSTYRTPRMEDMATTASATWPDTSTRHAAGCSTFTTLRRLQNTLLPTTAANTAYYPALLHLTEFPAEHRLDEHRL